MRAFVVGCLAAIVIAIGAAVVLDSMQMTASTSYTSATGVRL
jgi:hypothetical protein